MYCVSCGKELKEGAYFCVGCGTPTGLACGKCGAVLPVGVCFCIKCGNPVSQIEKVKLASQKTIENPIVEQSPPQKSNKTVIGDVFFFGYYPNNKAKTVTPIEWIVLDKKGKKALIISKDIIDRRSFDDDGSKPLWKNCSLRLWLNKKFLKKAFSKDEQNRILLTSVVNDDESILFFKENNDTEDRIFLLSVDEVQQYFHLSKNKGEKNKSIYCYGLSCRCRETEYASAHGKFVPEWEATSSIFGGYTDEHPIISTDSWWLRSTDGFLNVAVVNKYGEVFKDGTSSISSRGVRPALWIQL